MHTAWYRLLIASFCIALTGCWIFGKELNERYCASHPDDVDCRDRFPDGREMCAVNGDCESPLICDVARGECVPQCRTDDPSSCAGDTPICDPGALTCRACDRHEDCDSDACLPSGGCAEADDVAYVDAEGTSNEPCTQASPCNRIASALATGRPTIKVRGLLREQVSITDRSIAILADRGAVLTDTSPGALLTISGFGNVSVRDLELRGATGPAGFGVLIQPGSTAVVRLERVKIVSNNLAGIQANGGRIEIARSSIVSNNGGGIAIAGADFDIAHNVIALNGTITSIFGGVRLDGISEGTRRFEFNTVAHNSAGSNRTTGVLCTLVTQAKPFSNNIVFGNVAENMRTQVKECGWTYSDIGSLSTAGVREPGDGNINEDPKFVDPEMGDFHIRADSPARNAADPAAAIGHDERDIDGTVRVEQRPLDMGADEIY